MSLFTEASDLLEKKHAPQMHSVAAALLTSDDEIITAVNIDHFLGFVCAETAALAIAINKGIYDFKEIVAVRKNDEGKAVIIDMCGKCRQIFFDYAHGIGIYTSRGERVPLDVLLPYAYERQRGKIEATRQERDNES